MHGTSFSRNAGVLLLLLTGLLSTPGLGATDTPTTVPPSGGLAPEALDALQRRIVGQGCEPNLLGQPSRRFIEAQLVCDAHLSFVLVQAALDGHPLPDTPERLNALRSDALDRARKPFLRGGATDVAGHLLPTSVLYRGYLLLMLAGQERAGLADAESTALFDALAAQLVDAYARQPLLPSFGASIWPCDNALAAAGLALHGRLRRNERSVHAGERLTEHLSRLAKSPTGFPAKVDAKGRFLESTPRGTTLAWTGAFLAMGGLTAARDFTATLVRGYCDRVSLGGLSATACREWPRGVKGREDSASGPLIQGYSVGASALAVAATRLAPEYSDWHQRLVSTANTMGIRPVLEAPDKHPLEAVLYFWGTTAKPW